MGPPVVVIVTTVAISVGVAFVVTHHVWPHVKPQAEDLFRRFSEARRRRREEALSYSTTESNDHDEDKSFVDSQPTRDLSPARDFAFRDDKFTPISSPAPNRQDGLRQRPTTAASSMTAESQLLDSDVEMVQLNKTKAFLYAPMTPTSTRPSSRAAATAVDDNPFLAEPVLPIPSSIPLPLSPSSSLVDDQSKQPKPSVPSYATSNTSFATALSANPQNVLSPSPLTHQPPSLPRTSSSRHHPSSSQSSNTFAPPTLGASGIRSPAVRATSPSGLSDTMSMVSAAPSRTWTEGGTADIFSGSERDFEGHESDEDDVRSVSDSGSWEELSNAPGAAAMSNSGRLTGR